MGSESDAVMSFQSAVANATPWTMLSEYNVNSSFWQGHYCLFGGGTDGVTAYPVDLTPYHYLKFRARARSDAENPKSFKIEIQSSVNRIKYIDGLTSTFQTFTIDLIALSVDRAAITQMNIVYERPRINANLGNLSGAVYFDNIEFSVNP